MLRNFIQGRICEMKGSDLVRLVEHQLALKGIPKGDFYKACNITSSTFSNWRNNTNTPTEWNVQRISQYLDIDIDEATVPRANDETTALRELIRDRQDLRVLLNSAKDVPASSVYALIAQIEKMKEDNK